MLFIINNHAYNEMFCYLPFCYLPILTVSYAQNLKMNITLSFCSSNYGF